VNRSRERVRMEARSTPALPTMRFPNKNDVLITFDMTAFSWKSPEPTPVGAGSSASRFTSQFGGGLFHTLDHIASHERYASILDVLPAGRWHLLILWLRHGQDSYTVIDSSSGLEKRQPSPTEDMTASQKLGWILLECLYGFAGSNPSFSP